MKRWSVIACILISGACVLSAGCTHGANERLIEAHGGYVFRPVELERASYVDFMAEKHRLTDDEFARLAVPLRKIGTEILGLTDAAVTDQSIPSIRSLPRLSGLNVCGTGITDAGLRRLSGMRSLRHLALDADKFSAEEAQDLKTALWGIRVVRLQRTPDIGSGWKSTD